MTPDGRWAFDVTSRSVLVLRLAAGPVTPSKPNVQRAGTVPLPPSVQGAGAAVSPDGKYLLVADGGTGVVVVSVVRAEAGDADAVLGAVPLGEAPVGVTVTSGGR